MVSLPYFCCLLPLLTPARDRTRQRRRTGGPTPALFLNGLYSHALLTMGNDGFFETAAVSVHNLLDEFINFSRLVFFWLYWREDTVIGGEKCAG